MSRSIAEIADYIDRGCPYGGPIELTPQQKKALADYRKHGKYKVLHVDGKKIMEHRFVMEQYLGRKLLPDEEVHHVNGRRDDNRLENLWLLTHDEHEWVHGRHIPNFHKNGK